MNTRHVLCAVCLVFVLCVFDSAFAASDPLADAALATPSIDLPPDWVVRKGTAEYQHWTIAREDGPPLSIGKVFVDGREVVGSKMSEKLDCDLGVFVWSHVMGADGPPTECWYPLLNTLESPGFVADLNMDVSDILGWQVVIDEGESQGEDSWFFRIYGNIDGEDMTLVGYGGVRRNGKWIFGSEPEQAIGFMGKELVWHGPWLDGDSDGFYGWKPSDSLVGDDIYEFARKMFTIGEVEVRAKE